MKRLLIVSAALLASFSLSHAYVEAPHTLGRCVAESTNIVLMEVTRVNKEKGMVIYKKVTDLKGKHPQDEIKHNIGQRGFAPREWQNIMKWAEVGKKAVFFYNDAGSETCIGTYWYQCYKEGEWWGMTHAEPFLLRTFCGEPEKLAEAVTAIAAGKEVIVPAFIDQPKREYYHERKGKVQLMKASLKLMEYDQKRDFVGWGDSPNDIPEYKTTLLLAQSTDGWKFLPAAEVKDLALRWTMPDFDHKAWRDGQAPIGYGEDEIAKRKGTTVKEQGVPFVFRREFNIPPDLLKQKDTTFHLRVASDDSAVVYLNGKLADTDPEADHEFAYWNRDLEIDAGKFLVGGRNVVAVYVKNQPKSSDIYLDMEIAAQQLLPRKVTPKK